MYSQNDYRNYLEHSWGKKPEQKAAEKAYNTKYYEEHKSKWAQYRENAKNAAKRFGFGYKGEINKNQTEGHDLMEFSRREYDKTPMLDAEEEYRDAKNLYAIAKAKDDDNAARAERLYKESLNPFTNLRKKSKKFYDIAREEHTRSNARKNAAYDNMISKRNDYNANRMAYNAHKRRQETARKEGTAHLNTARHLREEYAKTPLGKAEGAVNKGKRFISNLVRKKK